MAKTALVTGHKGFIGRHMFDRLSREGYATYGFDIADSIYPLDARDFFRTDDRHFDLVVHCAAVVGGRKKIEGAPLDIAVDLSIDAEMFQWAMRVKPGRVVYFSSSAAYPTWLQEHSDSRCGNINCPTHGPRLPEIEIKLNSEEIGTPDLTYGWTKLTGEVLADYYAKSGGIVHVFRPFSGYGTDQDLDYPFRAFIQRALNREDPFTVWGDGRQVRDFIHIDDILNSIMVAIEHDIRGPVNLCTGIDTSFNELANLITALAGYQPTIAHVCNAPVGVRYRVGDPTEMLKFYTPKISLEEGIKRALRGLS